MRKLMVGIAIACAVTLAFGNTARASTVPHLCSDLQYLGTVIGRVNAGGTSTDTSTVGGLIVAGDRLEKHAAQSKDKKLARIVSDLAVAVQAYSDAFQHSRVTGAEIKALQVATKKIPKANRC